MHTEDLQQHIARQPRGYIGELAGRLGISRVYLSQLAARQNGREPSPLMAVAIERATHGRVARWNLRPDDWHLIWPELIGTAGAPDVPTEEVRDAAA